MKTDPRELPTEDDTDFQDAIVEVAREMDSRRTLRDRVRDSGRMMELRLMLLWRSLGGA